MDELLTPFEPEQGKKSQKRQAGTPSPVTQRAEELQGLLQGIIADGEVNFREAEYLMGWLKKHDADLGKWPASALLFRVGTLLEDSYLDLEEQKELIDLLRAETGAKGIPCVGSLSPKIKYDEVAAPESFEGTSVCLTGTFRAGKREYLQKFLSRCNCTPIKQPSSKGCCVVVGSLGYRNPEGLSSKILKADMYRKQGKSVFIVPEKYWWEAMCTLFG